MSEELRALGVSAEEILEVLSKPTDWGLPGSYTGGLGFG